MVKKRWHWQWYKLIIDGTVRWVYPRSRIPNELHRLKKLSGIDLKKSTKKERKPYLEKEKLGIGF